MAFPGTFNFSYYKGDTFEFRVYPKDSSGGVYPLGSFSNAKFTLSQNRGPTGQSTKVEAFATIVASDGYLLCAIRPVDGNALDSSKAYVYDVEIQKSGTPYPLVYTLLTGTITIREQVTGA